MSHGVSVLGSVLRSQCSTKSLDILSYFHIAGSIKTCIDIGIETSIETGIESHSSGWGQNSFHIEEEKYH